MDFLLLTVSFRDEVAEAAQETPNAKIVKVNVDDNPNSPAQMGVRGIPALFMFKGGEVISNKIGAAPKAALQKWIDEAV